MRYAVVLLVSSIALAQGTKPKATAEAYPVHASIGNIDVGAEYLVHYVPVASGGVVTNDHLVVEVALFGPSVTRMMLTYEDFSLFIDGSKRAIGAQPPFAVLSASRRDQLPTGPRIGSAGRLPSPYPRTGPTVSTRRADPGTTEDDEVSHVAMPVGEQTLPVSGVLFFPHKGKVDRIKSLELVYEGP